MDSTKSYISSLSKMDFASIASLAGVIVTFITFLILHKNNRLIQNRQDQSERIAMQPFILPIPVDLRYDTEKIYGNIDIGESFFGWHYEIVDLKGIHDNPQEYLFSKPTRVFSLSFGLRNVGKDIALKVEMSINQIGTIEDGFNCNSRYRINNPKKIPVSQCMPTDGILHIIGELALFQEINTVSYIIKFYDKTQKRYYTQNIELIKGENMTLKLVNIPSTIKMFEEK